MFGDGGWEPSRSEAQERRLEAWLGGLSPAARGRLLVIECGAGTGVPTVRHFGERVAGGLGGTLVRINVREPEVPAGQVGISMGARAALTAIEARLQAG